MNYLTALLAFSAIMIVLSTLATVVVEGLHKLGRKRCGDFERMLQRLYDDAVAPRMGEAGIAAPSTAQAFAQQITRNPAVEDSRIGLLGKLPLLGNLLDTAFDRLTTRQFIEQFAQTEAGKRLRQERDNATSAIISELAYEFERYGEAATAYFERRAMVFSVLVAMVMALTLNVDAIRLYSALASDSTLSDKVITQVDVSRLEQAYLARMAAAETAAEQAAAVEVFEEVMARLRRDAQQLDGLALPIGRAHFPYCAGVGSGVGADTVPLADPRCASVTQQDVGSGLKAWLISAGEVLQRVGTRDGLGWLLSALLAGGMIGLGAPFWFKTYRYIAAFIPGIKLPDSTLARRSKGSVQQVERAQPIADTVVVTRGKMHPHQADDPAQEVERSAPASRAAVQVSPVSTGVLMTGLSEADLVEAFEKSRR